jgi:hypothetical protein
MADVVKPFKVVVGLDVTREPSSAPLKESDFRITAEQREIAVDADIEAFNVYFQQELGNDPLVRSERAIIKTFFAYHIGPKLKKTDGASGA